MGIEISDEAAHYARDVEGLDVRVGQLSDLDLPVNGFDLIILWHVLEHIPDPQSTLHAVARLLRPGGVLLVAVPNVGSPEARWGRDGWFHLDVPRHLVHFDGPTLRNLLKRAGLSLENSSSAALEYDLFSAVQTALNRLGLRPNLLYNLIRSRGARPLQTGPPTRATETLLTVALAALLSLPALLWVSLAGVTGRGATQTVLARKDSSTDRRA